MIKSKSNISTDHGQKHGHPQKAHAKNLENAFQVGTDGSLRHSGVEGESEEQSVAEAEEVHQCSLAEAHDHNQRQQDHEEDDVELVLVDTSDVVAVDQQGCELHSYAGAKHPTESENPAIHSGHCETVGRKAREQRNHDAASPAILEFVHDENGKDEVHDDMPVAVVQEHAGDELVEVLLLVFEEGDVEEVLVHLTGVLQELAVPPRWEQDVLDHEGEEADRDEEGGEGG